MKRNQYIEKALKAGYKIKDLDYMTSYEISKLPVKYDKTMLNQSNGFRFRPTSNSANKLTASETLALKNYFKKWEK